MKTLRLLILCVGLFTSYSYAQKLPKDYLISKAGKSNIKELVRKENFYEISQILDEVNITQECFTDVLGWKKSWAKDKKLIASKERYITMLSNRVIDRKLTKIFDDQFFATDKGLKLLKYLIGQGSPEPLEFIVKHYCKTITPDMLLLGALEEVGAGRGLMWMNIVRESGLTMPHQLFWNADFLTWPEMQKFIKNIIQNCIAKKLAISDLMDLFALGGIDFTPKQSLLFIKWFNNFLECDGEALLKRKVIVTSKKNECYVRAVGNVAFTHSSFLSTTQELINNNVLLPIILVCGAYGALPRFERDLLTSCIREPEGSYTPMLLSIVLEASRLGLCEPLNSSQYRLLLSKYIVCENGGVDELLVYAKKLGFTVSDCVIYAFIDIVGSSQEEDAILNSIKLFLKAMDKSKLWDGFIDGVGKNQILARCCMKQFDKLINFFVQELGWTLYARDKNGFNVLPALAGNTTSDIKEIDKIRGVKFLLKKAEEFGCKKELLKVDTMSPFHSAFATNSFVLGEFLLKEDIDFCVCDDQGLNALGFILYSTQLSKKQKLNYTRLFLKRAREKNCFYEFVHPVNGLPLLLVAAVCDLPGVFKYLRSEGVPLYFNDSSLFSFRFGGENQEKLIKKGLVVCDFVQKNLSKKDFQDLLYAELTLKMLVNFLTEKQYVFVDWFMQHYGDKTPQINNCDLVYVIFALVDGGSISEKDGIELFDYLIKKTKEHKIFEVWFREVDQGTLADLAMFLNFKDLGMFLVNSGVPIIQNHIIIDAKPLKKPSVFIQDKDSVKILDKVLLNKQSNAAKKAQKEPLRKPSNFNRDKHFVQRINKVLYRKKIDEVDVKLIEATSKYKQVQEILKKLTFDKKVTEHNLKNAQLQLETIKKYKTYLDKQYDEQETWLKVVGEFRIDEETILQKQCKLAWKLFVLRTESLRMLTTQSMQIGCVDNLQKTLKILDDTYKRFQTSSRDYATKIKQLKLARRLAYKFGKISQQEKHPREHMML